MDRREEYKICAQVEWLNMNDLDSNKVRTFKCVYLLQKSIDLGQYFRDPNKRTGMAIYSDLQGAWAKFLHFDFGS